MKAIRPEVRYLAIMHYEEHKKSHLTCKIFNISRSSLCRYMRLYKAHESLLPYVKTQPCKFTKEHHLFIIQLVKKKTKYYTVRQVQSKFTYKYSIPISERTIRRVLKKDSIVYKKLTIKSATKRPKTFKKNIKHVPLHRILAIDEMGFGHGFIHPKKSWCQRHLTNTSNMRRTRFDSQSKSIICVTSSCNIINYQWSYKAFNTASFVEFLRISLIGYSGYYLILDNVSFHKSKRVIHLLDDMGIIPIFIDPYTPEQNPIEEVFSSMKSIIRAACPHNVIKFERSLKKAACRQNGRSLRKYFERSMTH